MSEIQDLDEKAMAELSPQAAMRLKHAGQWVAWTEGFGKVVAAGDSRDAVFSEAKAAGVDRPICEWIPANLAKHLGSCE